VCVDGIVREVWNLRTKQCHSRTLSRRIKQEVLEEESLDDIFDNEEFDELAEAEEDADAEAEAGDAETGTGMDSN
jgi:hypothetical protein